MLCTSSSRVQKLIFTHRFPALHILHLNRPTKVLFVLKGFTSFTSNRDGHQMIYPGLCVDSIYCHFTSVIYPYFTIIVYLNILLIYLKWLEIGNGKHVVTFIFAVYLSQHLFKEMYLFTLLFLELFFLHHCYDYF